MSAELSLVASPGAPASSWKPYPAYKDSGVEWLGMIPEHWEVLKIKRIVTNHMQGYYSNQEYVSEGVKLLRITDIDDFSNINYSECPFVSMNEKETSDFGLEINDFLFARSGTIGRFGIIIKKEKAVFASYLIRFRFSNKLDTNFLKYYFFSEYFKQSLISDLHGGANQNIHAENIKNQIITIPSYPEQCAISLYLDDRTQKIDYLIEKKQKLIELLKEERAAVINQAVTKGLNLDAPMKDSGIEWLGEVPEKWEVKKLKYLSTKIGSGVTPKGGSATYLKEGIPLLRSQNIHFEGLDFDDVVYISEETHNEMSGSKVHPNDVLLNITGASIGRCHFVPFDLKEANVNQHVCIIRPNNKITTKYLFNYLCSEKGQIQIFSSEKGISREGLTFEQIANFVIILPQIEEQKSIVQFIESESTKIDSAVSRIEK